MRKILVIAFFFTVYSFCFSENNLKTDLLPTAKFYIYETIFGKYDNYLSYPDFSLDLKNKYLGIHLNKKNENFTYGTVFDFSLLNLSVYSIKAGTLNISGNIQKLSNPELNSNVSPFFLPKISTSIVCTLPSISSSSKKISGFISFEKKLPDYILQGIEFNSLYTFNTETKNSYFSVGLDSNIKPRNNILFCPSLVFQYTKVSNVSNDNWYMNSPFFNTPTFNTQFQFDSIIQPKDSFFSKIFLSTSLYCFTNNMFLPEFCFQEKLFFLSKKMYLGCEFFVNPNNYLITSSDLKNHPVIQLKTGIYFKNLVVLFNNPFFLKTGIGTYNNYNYENQLFDLKQTIGINLTNKNLNIKSQIDIKENILNYNSTLTSVSFNNNITMYLQNFTANISFSRNDKRNDKKISNKIGLGFTTNQKITIENNNSIEFIRKNGIINKINCLFSISSTFNLKKISCTGKISTAFNYDF